MRLFSWHNPPTPTHPLFYFVRMYLRYYDYLRLIQDVNLRQLITSDDNNRVLTEQAAQAEMISYLAQKFDIPRTFRDTVVYDPTAEYDAAQLVELNFTTYADTGATYTAGVSTVSYQGKQYVCKTAIAAPAGAFDAAKWTLLGNTYDLFYITFPYKVFDVNAVYKVGDIVFWRDNVYSCKKETIIPTHADQLQGAEITSRPPLNILPDDPVNGVSFWGEGVPYSFIGLNPNAKVADFTAWSSLTAYAIGDRATKDGKIWQALTANTDITPGADITNWQPIGWTAGDNRNPQLVQKMCYITIYTLCARIPTRNVPVTWEKRYDDTITWLKDAMRGEVIPDIALKPETAKQTYTRFGGREKNRNTW